jgi:hypothetical protein
MIGFGSCFAAHAHGQAGAMKYTDQKENARQEMPT